MSQSERAHILHAEIYQGPLDLLPTAMVQLHEPIKVSDLLVMPGIECPVELHEFIVVKVGGIVVERVWWQYVTIKPDSGHKVEICTVYQRGALTTILAVVAVAAAIAIGTFGIPFLGIAAGSLWANVIAAGIGIAAQLAIRALTAAPIADNVAGQGSQKIQPGINSNTPVLNDALPVIFGKIGLSPPHLCPPYTVWNNSVTSVVAVMGFQGPCQINKVLINGLSEDQIAGLTIEKREGWASDAPRTIGTETVIETRPGQALSNFDTLQTSGTNDPLRTQPLNQNDIPQYHGLVTSGTADDFTVRLLAQSGFSDSGTATAKIKVPLRIRIRLKGTTAWRNLPEIHLQDVLHGTGPMRAEVRCKFQKVPAGLLIGRNEAWNIWSITNIAGKGTAYEFDSDPYFQATAEANSKFILPTMTGITPVATGTTTSGFTFSDSAHVVGNEFWRCFGNGANLNTEFWSTGNNQLPATGTIQLASAQTIKSYAFECNTASITTTSTAMPSKWTFSGSNDGTNWTVLDTVDITGLNYNRNFFQVGNSGSYLYYIFNFTANFGSANNDIQISKIRMFLTDAPCVALTGTEASPAGTPIYGDPLLHSSDETQIRCRYASLDQDGVTFYLDPALWPKGIYEIQMIRGCASPDGTFNPFNYSVGSATGGFFAPLFVSNQWVAPYGYFYRSDLGVEVLQTHQAVAPFDPTGICMVAINAPSLQISSIYIEATRYAPDFDGKVWTEQWIPQKNPAALYRQVLLGGGNAMPVFDEIIDEAELQTWFQTCKANDYQCNAVLSGARVAEALQMLGSAGYAAPRTSNFYGIVEDKDVSAVPVSYAITPLNSRDQGTKAEAQNLPHAIHAVFADETDSYAQNQVDVYRKGYDATNSKLYESVVYTGHTALAKVQKRATFDMNQLFLRPRKYVREVGIEGFLMRRGDLVAINDDVLSGNHAAGWISSVQVSGGNVISVTLENIIPWSRSAAFEAVADVSTLTDILNTSAQMAVAIRVPGQPMLIKTVSEIVDKNTCTFVTPFPNDGSIKPDQMVIAGTFNDTHRRVKIFEIQPKGYESFTVTLVDEAPGLFA